MQPSVVTAEDLERRLAEAFPEAFHPDSGLAIRDVWYRGCRVRMGFAAHRLRPGGTISGPNLMLLAGVAMYVAVLASIGWQAARRGDKPEYQFPAEASTWCVASRMPADQARPAPGGRRYRNSLGGGRGSRGACHLNLFNPAQWRGFIIPIS